MESFAVHPELSNEKLLRTVPLPTHGREVWATSANLKDAQVVKLFDPPGDNGFVNMLITAWANHYPVSIRPDDVWLAVLQGISMHVLANAEALRSKFVSHDKTKHIKVITDETVDWDRVIAEIHAALDENVSPGVARALAKGKFTTTTATDVRVGAIAMMDMCSKYFTFEVYSRCGFPHVELPGTEQDWCELAPKVQALVEECCLPEFAHSWLAALLPVLQRFAAAKLHGLRDADDALFWDSMIKLGGAAYSGQKDYYNGWVHVFFPLLEDDKRGAVANPFCAPYNPGADYAAYKKMVYRPGAGEAQPFSGISKFPSGVSVAPVKRVVGNHTTLLSVEAGFRGIVQDKDTKMLRALVGWTVAIADDATQKRLAELDNTTFRTPQQTQGPVIERDISGDADLRLAAGSASSKSTKSWLW